MSARISGTNPPPDGVRPGPPPAPPILRGERLLDADHAEKVAAIQHSYRRERIATAALQGLLASTPSATQNPNNAEQYGTRAVRYADALIEALNRSTEGAIHARHR